MKSTRGNTGPKRQRDLTNRWNWTGFACAFVFFGTVTFLNLGMPLAEAFWAHVSETLIVATSCGILVGRIGDAVFVKILAIFPWF